MSKSPIDETLLATWQRHNSSMGVYQRITRLSKQAGSLILRMSLYQYSVYSYPLPEQIKVFPNSADEVFAQEMTENQLYIGFYIRDLEGANGPFCTNSFVLSRMLPDHLKEMPKSKPSAPFWGVMQKPP